MEQSRCPGACTITEPITVYWWITWAAESGRPSLTTDNRVNKVINRRHVCFNEYLVKWPFARNESDHRCTCICSYCCRCISPCNDDCCIIHAGYETLAISKDPNYISWKVILEKPEWTLTENVFICATLLPDLCSCRLEEVRAVYDLFVVFLLVSQWSQNFSCQTKSKFS